MLSYRSRQVNPPAPFRSDADQALDRDPQVPVQVPDHRDRQFAAAVEDFVHAVVLPDRGDQVLGGEPGLLPPELDCLDRIGRANGWRLAS